MNMSVNIKTLTIGSHVSVDGKRVRVCGITKRKIGYHHPDSRPNAHLCYARIHDVEPIPLTTALLEELGFEWRDEYSCWRMKYVEDSWIFIDSREGDAYRYAVYPECGDWRRPVIYAKYLHELEGQLAYYGIELIKD